MALEDGKNADLAVAPQECHATLFKPPLPDAKAAAIKRLGMGVVDKLFVTFKGLQKDTSRRYEFIWRAHQREALKGNLTFRAGT